jgi:23S rRNA (adenine2503-C2)-methyltransferase
VNLIPVNPTANINTPRSRRSRVLAFQRALHVRGINTTVRVEKGIDIAAGCGQLRGEVEGRRGLGGDRVMVTAALSEKI